MGSSVWTGEIGEFGLTAEGMGSMGIDIVVMFFLPRTIPHVPSMRIATANGDMPCTIPNVVFRVRPLVAPQNSCARRTCAVLAAASLLLSTPSGEGESDFVFLTSWLSLQNQQGFRGHIEL
jgi:hypothetical protein